MAGIVRGLYIRDHFNVLDLATVFCCIGIVGCRVAARALADRYHGGGSLIDTDHAVVLPIASALQAWAAFCVFLRLLQCLYISPQIGVMLLITIESASAPAYAAHVHVHVTISRVRACPPCGGRTPACARFPCPPTPACPRLRAHACVRRRAVCAVRPLAFAHTLPMHTPAWQCSTTSCSLRRSSCSSSWRLAPRCL